MRDASAGLLALCNAVHEAQNEGQQPLRVMRPSVMDPRFRGDACVLDGDDGLLSLCLGNFSLAQLPGVPFDLPHLNALVGRLRHPRRTFSPSRARE